MTIDHRMSWLGIVVMAAAACSRQPPPQAAPAAYRAQAGSIDWPTYNASLTSERFSPVQSLSPQVAPSLRRTCDYDTGKADISAQTGPLEIGGTLYFTDEDTTYAVDAVTCQEKWKHVRDVQPKSFLRNNRGAAYLDGRLFRGYADGHVLAFDIASGRPVWDVRIADPARGESVPMAPIAWNGMVYIGNAGGDNLGVTGRVYALRVTDGSTAWRFDTVPDTPEVRATWPEASARNPPTGGALWGSFSLDPSTGVLYVTTGNAAPDFVLDLRTGKSLYTNAVIALDAHTGQMLAYVQPIGRDEHDHDVAAAPALITTRGGRQLVLAAAKDGRAYGIEMRTRHDARELAVVYSVETTTRGNLEERLSTTRPTRFCPGTQGGTEWNGPAYSPLLELAYVGAVDWCTTIQIVPAHKLLERAVPGKPYAGADDPKAEFGEMDPPAFWRGWLTAFDVDTGQVRWRYMAPAPILAGVTVTAGGLVFLGDLAGTLRALDARTGVVLWEDRAGDATGGGIVTYAVAGRPYVAVATGKPSPIWPVPKPETAKIVVYSTAGAR
jgi:alcohol dehydrogenase (cytochrome c)